MAIHENFLSAREAATMLNITPARIGVLCREGRFKGAEKIGAGWIIPREAVINHKRLPPGTKPKTPRRKDDETLVSNVLKELKESNNHD